MVDMETGLRGYMVTGIEDYLEPYNNGRVDFEEVMAAEQELTSDNPAAVATLKGIHSLEQEWVLMIAQGRCEKMSITVDEQGYVRTDPATVIDEHTLYGRLVMLTDNLSQPPIVDDNLDATDQIALLVRKQIRKRSAGKYQAIRHITFDVVACRLIEEQHACGAQPDEHQQHQSKDSTMQGHSGSLSS